MKTGSRFPWVSKPDPSFPGPHRVLLVSSVGNRCIGVSLFICIPTACVMRQWYSYVEGSLCKTADMRDLSPCHVLSTLLYDNRVFSVAPDGLCFHQACRSFVKWFITFPVSILLEFNAAQAPGCQRHNVLSRSVLQPYRGSALIAMEWLSHSAVNHTELSLCYF